MKNSLDIQAWRNKYIYQINESEEDEWDLGDYGDRWDVKELTVGDYIEPEMWDQIELNKVTSSQERNIFNRPLKITSAYRTGEDDIIWFIDGYYDVYWENWILKPQYRIVPPEDLNESEDDDWDLGDFGDRWDIKLLTVGDTITNDMWSDNFRKFFDNYSNDDWIISKIQIDDGYAFIYIKGINTNIEEVFEADNIDELSFFLKPQYKVVLPEDLNESEEEDEWDLGDYGDRWDVKELTVGDIVTPDMWNQEIIQNIYPQDDYFFHVFNKSYKIKEINYDTSSWDEWDEEGSIVDWVGIDDEDNQEYFDFNYLKPQYKIVPPEDLKEQEDDDWDLGNFGNRWDKEDILFSDDSKRLQQILQDNDLEYIMTDGLESGSDEWMELLSLWTGIDMFDHVNSEYFPNDISDEVQQKISRLYDVLKANNIEQY